MKILKLNSQLNKILTAVFDLILLGILYLITCVLTLGFGIGVATTALFTTLYKSILEDQGYVIKTYFNALKENVKNSTLLWLPLGLILILVFYNIVFLLSNGGSKMMIYLSLFVLTQLIMISLYTFALMATMIFESKKEYLFNAVRLVNTHIILSLSVVINGLVSLMIVYFVPLTAIIIIPTYLLYVLYIVRYKIINKYQIKKHI